MSKDRVVVLPIPQNEALLVHRRSVEEAGGAFREIDLHDLNKRREALADATVLVAQGHRLGDADFAAAPNLQAVCCWSDGIDTVDLDAATRHGIPVGNVPDLCIDEVADHGLMLLLACYRRLGHAYRQIHQQLPLSRFEIVKAATPWPRLRGLTLGLLAFGNIARALAVRGQALGMRVAAHDPYLDPKVLESCDVEPVSFDTLFERSDYLSVHTPLNPRTRHLVNAAALAKMKSSAFIINTARGPIIDEAALVAALQKGEIAGAGLDVFEVEPASHDNPLFAMPNVITTPHHGGDSDEMAAFGPESVMHDVATVLQGGHPRSVQNPAVLG
jgi:D-3-phosphoglycerate dehydrogenase